MLTPIMSAPRDDFVLTMRTRDLPAEWGGVVPTEVFIAEALRVVKTAEERGVHLRILGGLGIRLHSPTAGDLMERLRRSVEGPTGRRQEYTDLDLMGYWRENRAVRGVMESLGYVKRRATMGDASLRQIYFHGRGWFHVDVFYDALKMNHDIPFKGRLELDLPTATPADLLLSKVQIVEFNEKDLKDCWALLITHPVGEGGGDWIDAWRLEELLGEDWGFYYTATSNLRRLAEAASTSPLLTSEERVTLEGRVGEILRRVEGAAKGVGWKLRAAVGPRKKWYRPVETEATVGDRGLWRVGEGTEGPKP